MGGGLRPEVERASASSRAGTGRARRASPAAVCPGRCAGLRSGFSRVPQLPAPPSRANVGRSLPDAAPWASPLACFCLLAPWPSARPFSFFPHLGQGFPPAPSPRRPLKQGPFPAVAGPLPPTPSRFGPGYSAGDNRLFLAPPSCPPPLQPSPPHSSSLCLPPPPLPPLAPPPPLPRRGLKKPMGGRRQVSLTCTTWGRGKGAGR